MTTGKGIGMRIITALTGMAVAVLCIAGGRPAVAADAPKIAVVNLQKVLDTSVAGKAAQDRLKTQRDKLEADLKAAGFTVGEKNILVTEGRVRAGYAIGDILYAKADPNKPKAVLHIIGERPGTVHHNYSIYIAAPKANVWAEKKVDHDIVRVVSGISDTGPPPAKRQPMPSSRSAQRTARPHRHRRTASCRTPGSTSRRPTPTRPERRTTTASRARPARRSSSSGPR